MFFCIDDNTGSPEVGKLANLICIDVESRTGSFLICNAHSAVVYAVSPNDVNDVMVSAELLLRQKQYCILNSTDTLRRMGL